MLTLDFVADLKARPSMYIETPNFATICAYLCGIDIAVNGVFLLGFREYLVTQLGSGFGVTWEGLIMHLACPNCEPGGLEEQLKHNDQPAIDKLFEMLEKLSALLKEDAGLRDILIKYDDVRLKALEDR